MSGGSDDDDENNEEDKLQLLNLHHSTSTPPRRPHRSDAAPEAGAKALAERKSSQDWEWRADSGRDGRHINSIQSQD